MSCGVGGRRSLDPELLWLWCSPVATALISTPSLGTSICPESSPRNDTKKKKKKKKSKRNYTYIASGNVRWYSLSGKEFVSLKTKYAATIQRSNCTPGHLIQRNENYVRTKTCTQIVKPVPKFYKLCDSIYMPFWKGENYGNRKHHVLPGEGVGKQKRKFSSGLITMVAPLLNRPVRIHSS